MWIGGFSEREGRTWFAPWEFPSGMAPLPREATSSTSVNFEIYVISAKTEQPEAAWQWLSFLSRQLPNREAPARRSLLESDAFTEQVGEKAASTLRAALNSETLLLSGGDTIKFVTGKDFFAVFPLAISNICSGDTTAREALSAAQEQLSD